MGLLTLLQGCSAIQLGYNNGATFAHTYISSQIDLEPEQSALLKDKLKGLIEWHRANELPLIAKQLREVQAVMSSTAASPQKITPLQVAELNKSFQGTLTRSAEQIAPALAELLLTLNPSQMKGLQQNIEESNESYRDKWMPSNKSKRLQVAAEGMEKRLERWYGKLNDEQKLLIQEWAASKPDDADHKYAVRIEQQKTFLKLATQAANRQITQTELSAELIKWVQNWQTKREVNKGLKAMADQDRTVQLVVDVSNIANAKQRKHAAERAGGWAEDFAQLANKK
ncbi:MAG: DUF6279 family lipoprotein [Limnobacter sp.]|nr:DUF6279 family lipoprotein [Limnobacter sp.]